MPGWVLDSVQHNHLPRCKKRQLGKQNETLTWAECNLQCNSPLFNLVAGQVQVPAGQVPAGQVNFRGSLPYSESNLMEPMLHPVRFLICKMQPQ